MSINKVFGIGLQKTGTSSLGRSLEILGYRISHNYNEALSLAIMDGKWDVITDEVEKWDAFQDTPWPVAYKEMDKRFPGSKFILTVRDEGTWIESIKKHLLREYPFETWYYGVGIPVGNEEVFINRFRSHIEEVKEYFKDRPDDLLIIDWEKGDGWEKICPFLGKEIPTEQTVPHWNKNKTLSDKVKKKFNRLNKKIKDLLK